MNNTLNPVILGEQDYRLLRQYAESVPGGNASETMSLAYELNRATVVEDNRLPAGSVRLNSYVRVQEIASQKEIEFTIVMPRDADIAKQKISVLTPMGAALIGLRKGETVEWKMPAGIRRFKILDVYYMQ
ncbi:MAG: transcription elongation factor GreAB [Dyadobacter sp. 50-39]|uniref:GreA/GreB family elongation factor n=1 Tax=Dyadobacter sp. 50-39 TaxID=1895756 RepID=UPI0009601CE0|nr:GreA/GreB family elongation factor [Dyadobacter sp. 50-39]OJV22631.1 MAG: transcription elongation factor GreAB [Dyadobacter sp. 50-39]